jgi:hypothetical protein
MAVMRFKMRTVPTRNKKTNTPKLMLTIIFLVAIVGLMPIVQAVPTNTSIIGFRWNESSTSPILQQINAAGTVITVPSTFWDDHVIWGNMKTCVVNASNATPILYGTNNRGDGLDLTGAYGDVMVEIPRFYTCTSYSTPYNNFWISPTPADGFTVDPMFYQRGSGSEVGIPASYYYIGRYEASGVMDTVFKLKSATGKIPTTGAVNYIAMPDTNFNITIARTYAENKGTGWGLMNIWTLSGVKQLFYTEMLTLNSQAAWTGSRGVVDLPSGTNYAGFETGANLTDSQISTSGTGNGNALNGKTPVSYRGIQDLWGGVWEFTDGYNGLKTPVETYIINQTGKGTGGAAVTFKSLLDVTDKITIANQPLSANGYYTNIMNNSHITRSLFLPSATVGGSETTYWSDYYYERTSTSGTAPNILLSGGAWYHAGYAGVGYLNADADASGSGRSIGARLEFRHNTENSATITLSPSSKTMAIDETANFTISVKNVTPLSTIVSTNLVFNPAYVHINNIFINGNQPAGASLVALVSNTTGQATINYINITGLINGSIVDVQFKTTNPIYSISTVQILQPTYGNSTQTNGFMTYGTGLYSTITNAPLNDNSTVTLSQNAHAGSTTNQLDFWYKIPATSYASHANPNLSVWMDSANILLMPVTADGEWKHSSLNMESYANGDHTLTFRLSTTADGTLAQNYTYSLFVDDISFGYNWIGKQNSGIAGLWDTGFGLISIIIIILVFGVILSYMGILPGAEELLGRRRD